jgi:hypothetical protein
MIGHVPHTTATRNNRTAKTPGPARPDAIVAGPLRTDGQACAGTLAVGATWERRDAVIDR